MNKLIAFIIIFAAALPSYAARDISGMSDDEFLDMVEHDSAMYFIEHIHPRSGLIAYDGEHTHIGSNGFALNAFCIAAERKWITREDAAQKALNMLKTFRDTAKTKYGAFLWMCDAETANNSLNGNNFDIVETAYVISGALACKQYFNGPDDTEKKIRQYADDIYARVEFDKFTQSPGGKRTDTLAWHFIPEKDQFSEFRVTGYNECMLTYIVALGAPKYSVPAKCWNGWAKGYHWGYYYGQKYFFCPALFTHQYTQCWADLRDIQDKYTKKRNITYFENSRRAALSHVEYAKQNPNKFPDYGPVWGLTDCGCPLHPGGFGEHGFVNSWPGWVDDGTVAVSGSGASIMFTPKESIACLRYIYEKYGDKIYDKYGFKSAFNTQTGWIDPEHDVLNQGALVSAIENYRSGLIWMLYGKNPEISAGLKKAGFIKAVITEEKRKAAPGLMVSMLDGMDSADGWAMFADKGSSVHAVEVSGKDGNALEITYYLGGGNWIGVDDPAKYDLSKYAGICFDFATDGDQNKIEVKLEDADGSVFGIDFPTDAGSSGWTHKDILFDDLAYWWGGDYDLNRVRVKIRFAVSRIKGGSGKLLLDNLGAIIKK